MTDVRSRSASIFRGFESSRESGFLDFALRDISRGVTPERKGDDDGEDTEITEKTGVSDGVAVFAPGGGGFDGGCPALCRAPIYVRAEYLRGGAVL